MTPELIAAFVMSFGVGPLLYVWLCRFPIGWVTTVVLGAAVLTCALLAFLLTRRTEAVAALGSLTALWLGWVTTLAMTVQTLRSRLLVPRTQKLIFLFGLLATTLPWFGLATARWMVT